MIDTNVECDEIICKFKHGHSAFGSMDWQNVLFMLTAVAFAIDFTSVGLQLLVFWPLAMVRGVFRFILRTCSYLDFFCGIIKFCVAWVILYKQQSINETFLSYEREALKISLIPPACLQLSLILSFVAVVMLRVATDRGPPDGPTYLEIIEQRKREERHMRVMGSKASQYRPQSVVSLAKAPDERTSFSSTSV